MTRDNASLSFAFSLKSANVARKWEYVLFVQEKVPWSWKKQSHTWLVGEAALPLYGIRPGYIFLHSYKTRDIIFTGDTSEAPCRAMTIIVQQQRTSYTIHLPNWTRVYSPGRTGK